MQALHGDPVERLIAYRALFDTPMAKRELELFRDALMSGLPAGSDEFIERVAIASGKPAARRIVPALPKK